MPTRVLNILAVDDTPQNLLALQGLLDLPDTRLLTAESGPAALELLLQHDEVALALLDVQMPQMDGYALAELMRGAERTRHVPIIFLTANGPEEQRSFRGYEAGAVDFLVKPLDPLMLRSKVQVFVDLYRQRLLLAQRVGELERLRRLNTTMLSALSHDLRTPLAALTLNAELLLRRGDQAGGRIKAATVVLARQVEHLLNLGSQPTGELQPQLAEHGLGTLVRQRLAQPANQELLGGSVACNVEGDDRVRVDAELLGRAIDDLLLQAATHANEGPVRVRVDGLGPQAVLLELAFDAALSAPAREHLMGAGLELPQRVAHAHGGTLIGRSKEREGTRLEMMLPRGAA